MQRDDDLEPLIPRPVPEEEETTVETALLPSDRQKLSVLRQGEDFIGRHILNVHGVSSWQWAVRRHLQRFLTSKWGHYTVIALVSLDIAGIFADFLITLHICEHDGEAGFPTRKWERADEALDVLSLVFSSLFLAELCLSIFAFGFGFFRSKFHCFDAAVILAGFIVDVLLRGPVEEVGSLVVVGRLWRVFKIIEEFSSGASDQMEEMQEKIRDLQKENADLRKRSVVARSRDES